MLGFVKRQPVYAEPSGLLPIRCGNVLLAEHASRLARIRSMVGVPVQHWRLLYEALFAAYAEYVQKIPVPKSSHSVEPATQLRRALEAAELALKIRRGYVLPPGKEPEVVANEQDVWTYAVATATLLDGTAEALRNQQVTLYDRDRKSAGLWSPWTGSMIRSGNRYYRVEPRRSTASGLGRSALPLLVPYIVPQDGLRWLAGHEDALAAWLATIRGQAPDATPIADIIRKASQASDREPIAEVRETEDARSELSGSAVDSGQRPPQAHSDAAAQPEFPAVQGTAVDDDPIIDEGDRPETVPTPDSRADDPGETFLHWLSNGIASGVLAVNSAKAHLHVVDAGLLLASPAAFRAFAGENWRDVQKRFLKRKLSAKTAGGENVFHYRHDSDRGRKTIKGILILNPEETLGVSLPAANPQLAPKPDCR